MSNIIYHFNCVKLADLLAHLTSDTSYGADAHYVFALIFGTALYQMFLLIRYQFDQMSRADVNTFAAGLAGVLVYNCHAVHYMDRVKLTGLYTGAFAKTAVLAGLWVRLSASY